MVLLAQDWLSVSVYLFVCLVLPGLWIMCFSPPRPYVFSPGKTGVAVCPSHFVASGWGIMSGNVSECGIRLPTLPYHNIHDPHHGSLQLLHKPPPSWNLGLNQNPVVYSRHAPGCLCLILTTQFLDPSFVARSSYLL